MIRRNLSPATFAQSAGGIERVKKSGRRAENPEERGADSGAARSDKEGAARSDKEGAGKKSTAGDVSRAGLQIPVPGEREKNVDIISGGFVRNAAAHFSRGSVRKNRVVTGLPDLVQEGIRTESEFVMHTVRHRLGDIKDTGADIGSLCGNFGMA